MSDSPERDPLDEPGPEPSRLSSPLDSTSERPASPEETTAAWIDVTSTAAPRSTVTHQPGGTTLPSRPEQDEFPLNLPGYEILEKLPGGGMGIVYKARRIDLDTVVALKLLPPPFARDARRLARFWNEAKIGYGLQEAHILPVKDLLKADGCPVLVLPFIDGTDLARVLLDRVEKSGKLADPEPDPALPSHRDYLHSLFPLLDQLVEAVAAAHQADVLHRDIKPSNCLVDTRGNLYLSDFGLSRVGASSDMTTPGDFMGTRGYAGPEQWEGRSDIDQRADVFSLGATLYHLMTLRLPYGRDRVTADTKRAAPPSRLRREVPADFDAILLKALEPDRDHRYANAAELRDDWRLARAGLPPKARLVGPLGRLGRRVRRHPWQSASFALIPFLLLLSLLGLVPWRGGAVSPPNGTARIVRLGTVEPCSRFAFIPRSPATGEPMPDSPHAVRGRGSGSRTLEPGLYLLVIEWPDGRFYEVFRQVPRPGDGTGLFNHQSWKERNGVVELRSVRPPPLNVAESMVPFPASTGLMPKFGSPDRPVDVPAFRLDPHEFTVGEYLDLRSRLHVTPGLPPRMQLSRGIAGYHPDEPVRDLQYDEAVHYLELAGKRPSTYAECYAAATSQARQAYPWGNDPPPPPADSWPIGPVGLVPYDRTATNRPVLGLVTNVGEWTSTWPCWTLDTASAPLAEVSDLRIVFGAPAEAVVGLSGSDDAPLVLPHAKHWLANPRMPMMNVGFRGARSERPPYLDPPTVATTVDGQA